MSADTLKVLIANPACRRKLGDGLERYMMGSGIRFPWSLVKHEHTRPRFSMFPMFLGYTAALLEEDGCDVVVIDGVPLDLDDQTFLERLIDAKPDIVIFEPNSAVIDDVLHLAEQIKIRCKTKIVLVGSHVSAELQSVFHHSDNIDFAVMGEFELGVQALINAIRNDLAFDSLAGVAYRQNGQLIMPKGLAPALENLDSLPVPARHLFPAYFDTDLNAYHDGFNQFSPAIDMHATRGCPHRCNFCVWVQVLYDNGQQRLRSPSLVVDEMEMLVQTHGAKEIYFDDDNFTANKKYVNVLCDEMIRRGAKIPWSALADAIALNEGMLEKMAEAGCIGVKFGLDSADSDVLRKSNKPLKVSRVGDLVKKARKLGIKTHMTVVLGLSGETRQSLDRTFKFSCDLDIDSIQFSMATPIPGTALYDNLKNEQKLNFVKWEELDGYSSSVIQYDDFSRDYLEQFEFTAHTRWLRARLKHPLWILRQIRYLARLSRVQGWTGFRRRLRRGTRLVLGDSTMVGVGQNKTSIRW